MIVGLGNPGRAYSRHRHNIGFGVIDELGNRHGIEISKRAFGAFVGAGAIEGQAVLLVKPQTFMNVSGEAVAPMMRYYRLETSDIVVIHDDLDIELGRMKLAFGAGHGGHNGVRSIMEELKTGDFFRVRVGIGRPAAGMDAANYVLSPFNEEDEERAREIISKAADAVQMMIAKGLSEAQQMFNSRES